MALCQQRIENTSNALNNECLSKISEACSEIGEFVDYKKMEQENIELKKFKLEMLKANKSQGTFEKTENEADRLRNAFKESAKEEVELLLKTEMKAVPSGDGKTDNEQHQQPAAYEDEEDCADITDGSGSDGGIVKSSSKLHSKQAILTSQEHTNFTVGN